MHPQHRNFACAILAVALMVPTGSGSANENEKQLDIALALANRYAVRSLTRDGS